MSLPFRCARDAESAGACLVGYIRANFHDLQQVFGPPNDDGEWSIVFSDKGTVATIYQIRENGGMPVSNEDSRWHIGGHCDDPYTTESEAFTALVGLLRSKEVSFKCKSYRDLMRDLSAYEGGEPSDDLRLWMG